MSPVIYGIHPVKEALKSPYLQVEKILVAAQKPSPSFQSLLDLASQRHIPIVYTRRETVEQMAQGGVHQNIIAIAKEISHVGLQEILSRSKGGPAKALFLILDAIQDPQNFGSLIRTALGCGANGIIVPKDRAVGITPVVIKASAGATAHLPVAKVTNLARAIVSLQKEGIWVYGAAGDAKDKVYELDLTLDLAIVIGSEGKGIRPLIKKKCDRLFSIPMRGPIASFNAAVAGGMILYEAMRQRSLRT
ncbi:MAG: 23S rRNA (guanosine(2251)-2'-O)-methyltransferase RlmB [Thermodesulfobacteriota bacterium]